MIKQNEFFPSFKTFEALYTKNISSKKNKMLFHIEILIKPTTPVRCQPVPNPLEPD